MSTKRDASAPTDSSEPDVSVPAPTPTAEQPAAVPDPFAHVGDEHWGKGGSYVTDPKTGKRVPAPVEPKE